MKRACIAADLLAELDLDEQTVADTLESISGDLTVKAQNVAFVIRNLEATAEQIKEAEAAMSARRKAIENRADRIRRYLLDNMVHAGIQKIECPHFKLAVRDNPASVVIDEPGLIPSHYMTDPPPPPPAPDKKLIKKAIEDGFEVPGAHLARGKRLEIR
ncbi:MAG: siphovirus Gp157 family protein [Burkholderia gladioli]